MFEQASEIVTNRIPEWTSDHVPAEQPSAPPIALKFHGFWHRDDHFRSEIQIVSLLIGLFWEVEHSAIYKPAPNLRGRFQVSSHEVTYCGSACIAARV